MHTVILLILLATIVLFACKKPNDPPYQPNPDSQCVHHSIMLKLSGYSITDADTIIFNKYDIVSGFSSVSSISTMYGTADTLGYINGAYNLEYIIPATQDTYRISNLSFIEKIGAAPCTDSFTGVTITRNGLPQILSYKNVAFAAMVITLYKP